MRTLILFALLAALCVACADEPAQEATPSEPTWLTDRPENAHPYADETLMRFAKLVESDGWCDASWNEQGTLEVVHERTGLAFVLVPAGEFLMGFPEGEPNRSENDKQHPVTVSPFLLSRTECTQRAWVKGGGKNGSCFAGDDFPVEQVGWGECRWWCAKLGLRLPGESEWEYACRAGSTGMWCFGSDESKLGDYAVYEGNSSRQTRPVGGKMPNAWGLYDMHGNVWEWCEDVYAGGWNYRVTRGGGWLSYPLVCRSATRLRWLPGRRYSRLGFRPAADLPR
jgi:formylglycine-generating enzyme required for sulfatase activity